MKKSFLLCTVALFVCMGLSAQVLTLEDARALALLNSRSLAQNNNTLLNLTLNEQSQLYSRFPSLSAGYSLSTRLMDSDWNFVNPFDNVNASVSVSMSYDLLNEVKNRITRSINSIEAESTRKSVLAEYYNVLDSVDNAYYAALEAEARLEAAESSLETSLLSLSFAEIRQASGIISQGDYLRALADKESKENSRNQARRNLALNMTKLMALIGVTETFELEHVDFDVYEDVIQRLAGISDEQAYVLHNEFLKTATASNPSLARSALSAQTAELNLSNIKNDYIPTVSVSFSTDLFSYSSVKNPVTGEAPGFSGPSTNGISLSIRGSIPIDFWNLTNRIEKSTISRNNANLNYISQLSTLETNLQSELYSAYAQAESVLSYRRSLEITQRQFDYEMERYRLSQSSVRDLGDVSLQLINSRNSLISASYSFLQSLSRLSSLCAIDDEAKLLELLLTGN